MPTSYLRRCCAHLRCITCGVVAFLPIHRFHPQTLNERYRLFSPVVRELVLKSLAKPHDNALQLRQNNAELAQSLCAFNRLFCAVSHLVREHCSRSHDTGLLRCSVHAAIHQQDVRVPELDVGTDTDVCCRCFHTGFGDPLDDTAR